MYIVCLIFMKPADTRNYYLLKLMKLNLFNVTVMLLVSLCLSPVSVVTVTEVFPETNKPFLVFRVEGNKWASRVFTRS